VQTVVADHKYGTAENFVACQQRGMETHMGDARGKQNNPRAEGLFEETAFTYEAASNTYRCPAGQTMRARRLHPKRRTWEYHLPKAVCAACALRAQCTRAQNGRTIHRHEQQALLDRARAQAHSEAARRDRRRRQHLAEGSFADAANNHGFKRARWRRLWRVQIQDWLIAAVQNIKILAKNWLKSAYSGAAALSAPFRLLRRPFPTSRRILCVSKGCQLDFCAAICFLNSPDTFPVPIPSARQITRLGNTPQRFDPGSFARRRMKGVFGLRRPTITSRQESAKIGGAFRQQKIAPIRCYHARGQHQEDPQSQRNAPFLRTDSCRQP
jgi:hypothetical protein